VEPIPVVVQAVAEYSERDLAARVVQGFAGLLEREPGDQLRARGCGFRGREVRFNAVFDTPYA